ncbi:MAG: biotin/lipoyl-containing protein, partial [Gammaproteobacteria bacterium]
MATEVILPRVDMDMAEGKIAHWYVKDGDAVRKGQVLFEIETDKATMEVDAPADGTMHGIRGEIGVSMPVGEIVGWILAAGEAPPAESGPVAAPAAHAEA